MISGFEEHTRDELKCIEIAGYHHLLKIIGQNSGKPVIIQNAVNDLLVSVPAPLQYLTIDNDMQ